MKKKMSLIESLERARLAGVPLVSISTPDETSIMLAVAKALNGDGTPVVAWDCSGGTNEVNEAGRDVAAQTGVGDEDATLGPNGCGPFLRFCRAFPGADENVGGTIAFVRNADLFLKQDGNPAVLQGTLNLRDPYKASGRMLVLLSPGPLVVPAALRGHVVVLADELPDAGQLRSIIEELDEAATGNCPERGRLDEKTLAMAVEAVRGLHAFAAEQAVSMALREDGIDLDHLWSVKKASLQVRGLTFDECEQTLDDVGGLAQAKELARGLNEGPESPACYVQIEEIGLVFAGSETDSSNTSQDIQQVLLTEMETNRWTGIVAYGPPGTGKTFFSRVVANTYKALSLRLDINAAKEKFVGSSGENFRAALAAIKAMAGSNVFFIATSNQMNTLPAPVKRRFSMGTYYFDMPDDTEKPAIWASCRKSFDLLNDEANPADEGWSAANIRDCCFIAKKMGRTLKAAAKFIMVAGVESKDMIASSRANADGKFLSASHEGVYRRPADKTAPAARKVSVAKGMAS